MMIDERTLLMASYGAGRDYDVLNEDASFARIDGVQYVILRFTDSAKDIDEGNLPHNKVPTPTPIGDVHTGYWRAVNRIIPHLLQRLRFDEPIRLCGFSRGGGLAAILAELGRVHGMDSEGYAVGARACINGPQSAVTWWISRDDELASRHFEGYERDGDVHWLSGAKHRIPDYSARM